MLSDQALSIQDDHKVMRACQLEVMVADSLGALSSDALHLPSPAPSIFCYFQRPATTNSSIAQGLMEPLSHTHRKSSMSSYLPKAPLSQSLIAVGIGKPSCLL